MLDPNILQGFWIEQDGLNVMIDVTTQAAFQTACDACCGTVPDIIANNYGGNVTDFAPLTLNSLCIYRFDDGSAGAHDAFAWDYTGKYVGKAQLRSNFSNTSHYTIKSYYTYTQWKGLVVGTDVVYSGACSS